MILPEEDKDFLNSDYSDQWEELSEAGKRGLLIKDYPLPEGYTPRKTNLMLLIPDSYPAGMIDMFYFDPPVKRQDGVGIAALADEPHFYRQWQRWSRHYVWRAGIDNISTHITYVFNQLRSEIKNG